MSLFKIAWRSVQQRGLASALTTFSMALGVMLVVVVLSVHGIVTQSFRNNANLGYQLIVGAKGSPLQLTLNTVFYLSRPVENIPYDYYLEFLPAAQRRAELEHALVRQAREAQREAARVQALASSAAGLPSVLLPGGLAPAAAMGVERDGRFAQFTAVAIPVCLGDYFREYRVVGTTPAMFEDRVYDESQGRKFEFAAGRNFQTYSDEHGYFEAVVGAHVARKEQVSIGDIISPSHGAPEGEGEAHASGFHVVGILAPSGTPNDRAVFINIEGFYLMEDHAKPIEEPEDAADTEEVSAGEGELAETDEASSDESDELDGTTQPAAARRSPLPIEQREVTAILLRTVNPFVAPGVSNAINEGQVAQAVPPIREIFNLLNIFVQPVQLALLGLTFLICVVSGISILVSIYNSMSDRKREIAIMRALGAGRTTVMSVILLESIILSLGGGVLGWVMGHGLNKLASPIVEDRTGVSIGFWDLAPAIDLLDLLRIELTIERLAALFTIPSELLLVPGLVVLAILVGFLPAVAAYRTDVAKTLAS